MGFEYEIYRCNDGNPTAIITNNSSERDYRSIAETIYQTHPEVDQVAVVLNVNDNECTFQLVNGEFCGNACLAISAYIYDNYHITESTIINKIKKSNGEYESIEIKSKCGGKLGNLLIPRSLFLTNNQQEQSEDYIVKMNGISHLIIPQSFLEMNGEYAKKQIEKLEGKNLVPDVFGIIFLENNKIDPYIWIKRIGLLQHQQACLSGSIAALEYLINKRKTYEREIIQPTGKAYEIEFKKDHIDITGTLQKVKK